MSAYREFIWDFPRRCAKILQSLRVSHKHLDVTTALMVAASGLTIPWERLKEHPFKDRERYTSAVESFDSLKRQKFLNSPLWGQESKSWCRGEISLSEIGRGPDAWSELAKPPLITPDLQTEAVLSTLRNALAHGNIVTRGNPIDQVIFIKEHRIKDKSSGEWKVSHYWFVSVTPQDFHLFLNNWFRWLETIQMRQGIIEESLDQQAA